MAFIRTNANSDSLPEFITDMSLSETKSSPTVFHVNLGKYAGSFHTRESFSCVPAEKMCPFTHRYQFQGLRRTSWGT